MRVAVIHDNVLQAKNKLISSRSERETLLRKSNITPLIPCFSPLPLWESPIHVVWRVRGACSSVRFKASFSKTPLIRCFAPPSPTSGEGKS